MKSIWTLLACTINLTLMAQVESIDRKIVELEAYKKYQVTRFDKKEDMVHLSDSIREFLELTNYSRKSKTDFSGKTLERSRTKTGERDRIYYFNEKGKLIAMVDRIREGETRHVLTYYFQNGQLEQVRDENKNDLTSTIDKGVIYFWIRRMFDDTVL